MRAKKQLRGAIASGALAGNVHGRGARGWQPAAAAWWVAVAIAAMAAPAQAQTPQAVAFDIPAQPLAGALRLFSQQAKQQVLFDQATVAGRSAPAVQGPYTPRQALDQLLAGTGIAAVESQPGAFTLRTMPMPAQPTADATLATVTVTAQAERSSLTEGRNSYASSEVSMAKGQSLREIPQSVSVITRQRIEDQGLGTLEDVLNQTTGITSNGNTNLDGYQTFYSRGYALSNIQIDGANAHTGTGDGGIAANMAMYDHVEVLRGSDGLYGGAGVPSGSVNLVRKKPLDTFQANLMLGAGSWNNYRAEADLSTPLTEDGRVREPLHNPISCVIVLERA